MGTVGKLDQNHTNVLGHGQDHLAKVLGLFFLMARKINSAQLCYAIHKLAI